MRALEEMRILRTKKKPARTCIGCGIKKEKKDFVRVVRTPDGQVILDKTAKAQGRGAYICPNEECLKQAVKKKGIERALKVQVSDELLELLVSAVRE